MYFITTHRKNSEQPREDAFSVQELSEKNSVDISAALGGQVQDRILRGAQNEGFSIIPGSAVL